MTKQEIYQLFQQVKDILKDKLNEKGEVFYNSYASLSKGDVYILGINPGYGGEENLEGKLTIEGQLDKKLSDGENAKSIFDNKLPRTADAFHKRSREFIEGIGLDYKKVFATNAFFEITKKSEDLNLDDFEKYYWPVHKLFLDIIQPKVIICIGYDEDISSFSLLRKQFKIKETNYYPSKRDPIYKFFDVNFQDRDIRVFAIKHFSTSTFNEDIQFAAKAISRYLYEYKEK